MDLDDYAYNYDDGFPFRSRENAHAMMGRLGYNERFRRDSRGIHDECCVKACTIDELISYCAKK